MILFRVLKQESYKCYYIFRAEFTPQNSEGTVLGLFKNLCRQINISK